MRRKNPHNLGRFGEDIAQRYLITHGYTILERNFHTRYTELDIVALENKTLVFIEVKTRRGSLFGTPEEAITPYKLRTLIRSAQYYKLLHPELPDALRIDVVAVRYKEGMQEPEISLYKNITL